MITKLMVSAITLPAAVALISHLPLTMDDGARMISNSNATSSYVQVAPGQNLDQAFAAGRFEK